MEDTQQIVVTINDVNIRPINQSMVYTLDTTGGKYQFWDKKQDGSDTKAMEQWKKFNFRKGDRVDISYVAKESGKVNTHTGQPFVNKTILFFNQSDSNTPSAPNHPNATQSYNKPAPTGSNAQLDRIEQKLDLLLMERPHKAQAKQEEVPTINLDDGDDEIRIEDVPFN